MPTYVHVPKFDVVKIFDAQHKSKLETDLQKMAARYVEKSRDLTTKGDKKQKGFLLGGSLTNLVKGEKGGKTLLVAELKLYMATWPKKSMFAFPSAKARVEVLNEAKIQRDIDDLLDSLLDSLITKTVNKEFEKRAKKLAKAP